MPDNSWDAAFRHYLEIYFEFNSLDDHNAEDLIYHIAKPGISLREAVHDIISRPRKDMPPRKISHPVRDWDALWWAFVEADNRCNV